MSPEELPPLLLSTRSRCSRVGPKQVGLLLMRPRPLRVLHGLKCSKKQFVPHFIPVALNPVARLRDCSAPEAGLPSTCSHQQGAAGSTRLRKGKGKNLTWTSTLSPNTDGKRNTPCLPEATSAAGGFMLCVSILLAGKDY